MNQSWENYESGPILAQIWVPKFFCESYHY